MSDFFIDRKCRKLLNYLKKCKKYTLNYFEAQEKLKHLGSMCEIDKMIHYLKNLGYVEILEIEPDIEAGVTLEYKGIHWKKFIFVEILRYISEKWIDFLSMATSMAALILSLISLLSQ